MAVGLLDEQSSVGVSSSSSHCRPASHSRFDRLVLDLKRALGPSSGLTSEDVDVDYLTRLMANYDAHEEGWMPYNLGDASRGYTRNLVDEGNGKSNLVRPWPMCHPSPMMHALTANTAGACLVAGKGEPDS